MPNRTALFSRHQPGGVFTIADLEKHPGSIFFVDSTHAAAADAAGGGQNPDTPLATIDYAIGLCTANKGDVIYVMPGHVENVAASNIACDVAGVSIIGLGTGAQRPTLTWNATASNIIISANSVTIKNIRCTVSIDEVVSMFLVTGTDVTLDAVDFFETPTFQAIQFLLTTSAAARLVVKNCHHSQITAPTAVSKWIQLVGNSGSRILDNLFRLVLANNSGSITISGSTDPPNTEIARNTIIQTGGTTQASAILLATGTGCFTHDNRVACGSNALAGGVAVGSAGYGAENYVLNTPALSGLLDPIADS